MVLRRGIVPNFFVTVTAIMILAMFIFYFYLKQHDKHRIRHYDCEYDCDYDKKIRYKYGPLFFLNFKDAISPKTCYVQSLASRNSSEPSLDMDLSMF